MIQTVTQNSALSQNWVGYIVCKPKDPGRAHAAHTLSPGRAHALHTPRARCCVATSGPAVSQPPLPPSPVATKRIMSRYNSYRVLATRRVTRAAARVTAFLRRTARLCYAVSQPCCAVLRHKRSPPTTIQNFVSRHPCCQAGRVARRVARRVAHRVARAIVVSQRYIKKNIFSFFFSYLQ